MHDCVLLAKLNHNVKNPQIECLENKLDKTCVVKSKCCIITYTNIIRVIYLGLPTIAYCYNE